MGMRIVVTEMPSPRRECLFAKRTTEILPDGRVRVEARCKFNGSLCSVSVSGDDERFFGCDFLTTLRRENA